MSSLLVVVRDLSAWFSTFDTAHLRDLGSNTGYHTLISLKMSRICLFIMPAVSIPITILSFKMSSEGGVPLLKFSNFTPVY